MKRSGSPDAADSSPNIMWKKSEKAPLPVPADRNSNRTPPGPVPPPAPARDPPKPANGLPGPNGSRAGPPAAAPARAYASQSAPNWSYLARLPASESTAFASLIDLNRRSAALSPGCLSGCDSRASLRKAFLISAWVAVLWTPSVL